MRSTLQSVGQWQRVELVVTMKDFVFPSVFQVLLSQAPRQRTIHVEREEEEEEEEGSRRFDDVEIKKLIEIS